ncbi:MAG: carbon monoxide dehydrogenase subunit G [Alphaproteobacteria bacterium]|nr:carbon monoxide dehydrogenase subunit G [Alphaproteobacteria bacterium]
MEFTGEYLIPADRAAVWRALNDTDALKASIPGCEEIERHSDTELSATVTLRIGPVAAKFRGKVTLSELDPPNGYRIDGEGQGGVAGFARGGAKVTLKEAPDGGTVLSYTADAQIGGKLAQIGSRLIDGAAKKIADEFFERFAAQVKPTPAAEAPAAAPVPTPEPGPAPAAAPIPSPAPSPAPEPDKALPAWLWPGLLILAVLILLYLFAR